MSTFFVLSRISNQDEMKWKEQHTEIYVGISHTHKHQAQAYSQRNEERRTVSTASKLATE